MADEIKIESQDNTSELDILKKRIDDVEMAMGAFNPRNMAGLRSKDLNQAINTLTFYDTNGAKRLYIKGDIIQMYDENESLASTFQSDTYATRINSATDIQLAVGNAHKVVISAINNDGSIEPAVSGTINIGSATKRFGEANFNGYLTSWYNIRPNTDPSCSSIGASDRYFMYLYSWYVRYKDIAAFKSHDDIALIKNIKEKTITRTQVDGFDKDNKPKKREEIIDVWDETTMPPEVYKDGFYDAGAVQGLTIGTLKQIIDKIDAMEQEIKLLKNK